MSPRVKTDSNHRTANTLFEEYGVGEDYASLYDLELNSNDDDPYTEPTIEILNDNEQYILDRYHEHGIAVEGDNALSQLVVRRHGDISSTISLTMGGLAENIERIEAQAGVSRLARRYHRFNDKLYDHTGKLCMQTNSVAGHTMREKMRRDTFKRPVEPPPPPRRRRKGLIPAIAEFLFGEE